MSLERRPIDRLEEQCNTVQGSQEVMADALHDILTEEKITVRESGSRMHRRSLTDMKAKIKKICTLLQQKDADEVRAIIEWALVKLADQTLLGCVNSIYNESRLTKRWFRRNGLAYMVAKSDYLQTHYEAQHPELFADKRNRMQKLHKKKKPRYMPYFTKSPEVLHYLQSQQQNDIVTMITNHIMGGWHLLDGKLTDDNPHSGHVAEQSNRQR